MLDDAVGIKRPTRSAKAYVILMLFKRASELRVMGISPVIARSQNAPEVVSLLCTASAMERFEHKFNGRRMQIAGRYESLSKA